MKRVITLLLLFLLPACSGCSIATPKTPQQVVYDLRTAYAALLVLEIQYDKLPVCSETSPPGCADPATSAKVASMSDAASTATLAAEKLVRTPGFGDSTIKSAIDTASAAIGAYDTVVKGLKVTP